MGNIYSTNRYLQRYADISVTACHMSIKLYTRAVVATDRSLSTVESPVLRQSRLSRQGGPKLPGPFSVDRVKKACRQSKKSRLSRHCRDRLSTTALLYTLTYCQEKSNPATIFARVFEFTVNQNIRVN